MKTYRNILLMAALLSGCFFIWGCENDEAKIDELVEKKIGVEEGINIQSYMSQDGKMKGKLTSPYMLRYQVDSPYIEFPKKLHVDFYNDSLLIESVLDANYAKYKEGDRKVYLKDSIVVINKLQGDTLKTDELWWDQNKQIIYTDRDVEIRQKGRTIFGKGLTAAQNFSEYTIFKTYGTVLTSGSDF